jgi:hypothetical protein
MGTVIELEEQKVRTLEVIARDLEAFSGMPLMLEAQLALRKAQRLMLPVFMGLSEEALNGQNHPDEAPVFMFSGSGASDSTNLGLFRELMGDEREALKEYDKTFGGAGGDN